MSYQALYRKYRPVDFDGIVGQDVVKKTLQNSLKTGKISHAYLFSGPRGTGKTSIAKILAKAVNCLQPNNGNPCQTCENCIEANSRECADIIEIDAASNNGVDEIRELRSKITLVPAKLKYKVYIIDEVHMLSIGAFNALLKTLEEPPSHIIFILATTDLHKVPVTIISRCQCFSFRRIAPKDMLCRLREIISLEHIEVEEGVLEAICDRSDGGMRDALGMLDKLVSYTSSKITTKDLEEINGIVSKQDITDFIQHVVDKDIPYLLEKLNFYYQNGKDLICFAEEILLQLRDQLVDIYVNKNNQYDPLFIDRFAMAMNDLLNELKNCSYQKTIFEITLLNFVGQSAPLDHHEEVALRPESKKMAFSHPEGKEKDVVSSEGLSISSSNAQKVDDLSNSKEKENAFSVIKPKLDEKQFQTRLRRRIENTFARAQKSYLIELRKKWSKIMDYTLDRNIGAIACFLVDATIAAASDRNLILVFDYPSMISRGNDMLEQIEMVLKHIFDHEYKIVLLTKEQWEQEKQMFMEHRRQNYVYQYQEEVSPVEEKSEQEEISSQEEMDVSHDIVQNAISLFGSDIVKIEN